MKRTKEAHRALRAQGLEVPKSNESTAAEFNRQAHRDGQGVGRQVALLSDLQQRKQMDFQHECFFRSAREDEIVRSVKICFEHSAFMLVNWTI